MNRRLKLFLVASFLNSKLREPELNATVSLNYKIILLRQFVY